MQLRAWEGITLGDLLGDMGQVTIGDLNCAKSLIKDALRTVDYSYPLVEAPCSREVRKHFRLSTRLHYFLREIRVVEREMTHSAVNLQPEAQGSNPCAVT